MKKISRLFSCVLSFCMMLSPFNTTGISVYAADKSDDQVIEAWDGTYDTSWYDAQDEELHIFTASELAGLAYLVNEGQKTFEGQTVFLESDLNLQGTNWAAIGHHLNTGQDNIFMGVFDGKFHSIENMSSICPEKDDCQYAGLFGKCFGKIQNVIIKDCKIKGEYCGGICSELQKGSVTNSTVSGEINSGTCAAGGIAGIVSQSTIEKCNANIKINSSETRQSIFTGAGGICGSLIDSTISNCATSGTISRNSSWYGEKSVNVGGICGYTVGAPTIRASYSSCTVTAISIAKIQNEMIDYKKGIAGGITGNLCQQAKLDKVYFSGIVSTSGLAGGIMGINAEDTIVSDAFYISSAAPKGAGKGEDTTIAKSAANMKKEEFAKSLGDAFVYVEGSYPKLAWELDGTSANTDPEIAEMQIKVGESTQMIVTNYTGNVTWVSQNPEIATINSDGVVTGVKPGKATIFAILDSGKALSGTIEVVAGEIIAGDCNNDGKFDAADVESLLKYLTTESDTIANWKAADLNNDEKLNAIDIPNKACQNSGNVI